MTAPLEQRAREVVERKAFLQGFGIALAALIRDCDCGQLAKNIAVGANLDLRDFRDCGLEDFDMKPLRSALAVRRLLSAQEKP